jgi:hypothetical protein
VVKLVVVGKVVVEKDAMGVEVVSKLEIEKVVDFLDAVAKIVVVEELACVVDVLVEVDTLVVVVVLCVM